MNEFFRQVSGDARRIWEQMTAAQRVLVGVVIASTIALFAFLVVWAQQPNYVPLFSKQGDKDAGFIEDEQQTTASVLLTMQPMAKLELEQVKTIQHLVSKAVPKLSMDQVFVTDTAGRDYTEEMAKLDPKNLSGTDLSARQLD